MTHFLRLNKNCFHHPIIFIFCGVVTCYLPYLHLKFEHISTNGCRDIYVQSFFVRAKSAKFAFRPFLSWCKILFFLSYITVFAEVTQVQACNHVPKFQTCLPSGFWVIMVQILKKKHSLFSKNLEKKMSVFFKIWTIITQKSLDRQVWNFGSWLYAWPWVTSAKTVIYDRKNSILHQLKNGRNANIADFALTNKLWM